MPKEIASDLARLALFDIILYVDDSGSMAFEQGGERIDVSLCFAILRQYLTRSLGSQTHP